MCFQLKQSAKRIVTKSNIVKCQVACVGMTIFRQNSVGAAQMVISVGCLVFSLISLDLLKQTFKVSEGETLVARRSSFPL